MIRTEITGAEIAEEMEKERRLFQLQMCEVSSALNLVRAPALLIISMQQLIFVLFVVFFLFVFIKGVTIHLSHNSILNTQ